MVRRFSRHCKELNGPTKRGVPLSRGFLTRTYGSTGGAIQALPKCGWGAIFKPFFFFHVML